MKFSRVIGASLLASCVSGSAGAAGPGVPGILDRPTPPACCADGICYPNPTTWGAYPTRWRRWPSEALAPTPADAAAPSGRDLPALEPPGPEDEDRQAPRPTPTPEAAETETDGEIRRPPTTPPATPSTPPLTPPVETPGTPPLTPPLDTTPGTPFEDDQPGDTENGLPFHSQLGPQSDDPPPSPPFRAPKVAEAASQRMAAPSKIVPTPAPAPRAVAPAPSSDSDDPPPAFPLTLG
jgi:hypothetical protein